MSMQCVALVITIWSADAGPPAVARPIETLHYRECARVADVQDTPHPGRRLTPCEVIAWRALQQLQRAGLLPGSSRAISYTATCEAST